MITASAGQALVEGAGQEAVLDEGAGVEQQRESLADR